MLVEERAACPSCGHGNPTENRFCGSCGSPLRGEQQLAPRQAGGEVSEAGAALPARLAPVGRALAVGVAVLAAEAGLAWLRRRAGGSGRPSPPTAGRTGTTIPEHPMFRSLQETHVWLREGEIEGRIFSRRAVTLLRTTNPIGGRGGGS